MANNNLADIVNVQIEIQSPALDRASFSTLLLLGMPPTRPPEEDPPDVGVYTSLAEVKEAGWRPRDGDIPSDPVYEAANMAFSQSPQPASLFIAVRQKKEDDDDAFEPVTDTLDRALDEGGWYGIAPAGVDESLYEDIAKWTEANEKLFGFTVMGLTSPLDVNTYMRTFGIYGKKAEGTGVMTPVNNVHASVAWFCDCFTYQPGSETWALKTLSAIEPSKLTSTQRKKLKDANMSYYTTYGGKNITQGGKTVGGEWIDVIRFRDWLKNDMQLRLYNLLVTHPKIPYTDSGIAQVETQMLASLKQGQRQGGIAEDEFTSEGVKVPGFTVHVPRSMDLTASDKASRILKGCKFTARLAGAIHAIDLLGSLTYDAIGEAV